MSKPLIVKCPICKILVERNNDDFPFCSARCKTTDLGNWASDAYSIPDTATPLDFDEGEDKAIH